ncbi:hypothetical protein CWC22_015820 [Pseudoalteromonas rubra]|uniref:Uncharacterized protein n=1 Tax=Pseudoalteromonas rubra TaxID=43658 RepID=A0A5S3UW13_9GAMM|nr:hypothetical protein [Pseudoalteromonas rubra]QPB84374.1 hypothetical protein CWC22_015820 [Pseudoalteromonas rubra]
MKNIVLVLALLILSVAGFKAQANSYVDTYPKVTKVYVNSGGLALIRIESHDNWLELGKVGDAKTDAWVAIALAAALSGKKTWIRYYPSTSGYPRVSILSVSA